MKGMCERGRTGEAPTRQRTPRSRRRCRVGLTTTDIMEVLKVCTSEGAGAQAAEQAHLPPYLRVRRGARTTEQQPSRTAQKGVGNMGSGCAKRNGAPGTTRRTRRRSRRHLCEDGGRLREAASRPSEGSTAPQSLTANSEDAEEERRYRTTKPFDASATAGISHTRQQATRAKAMPHPSNDQIGGRR